MKPSRRQFLALASTAGAWVPFSQAASKLEQGSPSTSGQASIARNGGSAPLSLFDGTSLSGWRKQGPAQWSERGELLGSCDAPGGGWLIAERGFEDFVLRFAFRPAGGEAGVLLRNAPLAWSRFSHPAANGGQTMGVYVALTGAHAGEMSLLHTGPARKTERPQAHSCSRTRGTRERRRDLSRNVRPDSLCRDQRCGSYQGRMAIASFDSASLHQPMAGSR